MAFRPETEALAQRAAAGDTGALDALLAAIRPELLRHCGRILPCPQDAEEACQDALLQVARRIDRFEGRSAFSTWAYVVATNCARQTYRSLKRRAAERVDAEAAADRPDPRTTSVIAGSRLDFLDALERLEAHRSNLATVLVLRDLCQLDYDDIATQLALPVGTVKSQVHRARQHVRASLGAA
ncbi:RNA polymerase sigma factor [Micromonospora sp. NPDC000089]|uniref:RNA polymerase sigma factor n=1 Tax=unclassified Micromonospora TaxID=2617518 RepID=UPI00367BE2A6